MSKTASVIAVLVLAVASLSACGSSTSADAKPSVAEWRAAAEARMGHPFLSEDHWKKYQAVYVGKDGICNSDELALTLAVLTDAGTSVSEIEQDFKYACPDKLPALTKAAKSVQDSVTKAERICSTDPDLLAQEDRDYYDAVC